LIAVIAVLALLNVSIATHGDGLLLVVWLIVAAQVGRIVGARVACISKAIFVTI
jgi:hypothetical protein